MLEEELVTIAREAGKGLEDPKLVYAEIQRARLEIDTRKWVMSKQLPRRYSERIAVGGDASSPPIQLSNADAAREVAMILAVATKRRVEARRKMEAEPADENGHGRA